jgi:hypothetical protein
MKMYYQSSNAGYSCSSGACSYSALESAVASYSAGCGSPSASGYAKDISYMMADIAVPQSRAFYSGSSGNNDVYKSAGYGAGRSVTRTYYSSPNAFLNPNRPKTVFVGHSNEIKEFVEEAFQLTTGRSFPDDIQISVLGEEELKKVHEQIGGKWSSGIQGFAINRKHLGLISEIFIKKGELDQLMLTLGHELGHVLSKKLGSILDEEAKAFAFSIEWMKTIKQHNIANLSTAIQLDRPANNGIHDKALDFVLDLISKGKQAINVYFELIRGELRCQAQ